MQLPPELKFTNARSARPARNNAERAIWSARSAKRSAADNQCDLARGKLDEADEALRLAKYDERRPLAAISAVTQARQFIEMTCARMWP